MGFMETAAANHLATSEFGLLPCARCSPFANSSIRVLSRGQAEVFGYRFSSLLFLVAFFRPDGLVEANGWHRPNADMRNEKLTLFIQRKQSMDDLLQRFDGPRPVA